MPRDDLGGDRTNLAVLRLRLPTQDVEGFIGAGAHRCHDDPLGLLDLRSGLERRREVVGGVGLAEVGGDDGGLAGEDPGGGEDALAAQIAEAVAGCPSSSQQRSS